MEVKEKESKRTRNVLIILGIIFILTISIVINSGNNKETKNMITGVATIIDLGSDCYTCIQQRGYLDLLKEKYPDSINVNKIDIYENPEEAEKYEVRVIPTLIFLDKNGKQVERHEGLLTDIELEQKLMDIGLLLASCSAGGKGC